MKLKTIEIENKTYAEISNGKPVYVEDNGKEVAFDAPHAAETISRLNGEAKGHREAKEAAEKTLKTFERITDPVSAIKALETVKNLDDKKLVDAGEVEKVKAEAIKAVEEKYKPVVTENDQLKAALNKEMIGGSFSRSKFIDEKIAVPADMIEAQFGNNFSIKDNKIVAKDASGNPVYSKERPGEIASFDEALETLIEQYPHKDHILKGRQQSGSGSTGTGQNGAGNKNISRADFDKLPPVQQSIRMSEGFTLTD